MTNDDTRVEWSRNWRPIQHITRRGQ